MTRKLSRLRTTIVGMYDALPSTDKVLIHHRQSGDDDVDDTGEECMYVHEADVTFLLRVHARTPTHPNHHLRREKH